MILSLSHIDLDGVGSQIVLLEKYKQITRMNVNYGKIDEYLDIVDEYCSRVNPNKVYITDLSFTYTQLENLSIITKKHPNIQFYFIDHHPFEEGYKHLNSTNLTIIISEKASATKLTFLYLKKLGFTFSKELLLFVERINAYDLWIEASEYFKVGFVYNELFWKYKINHFWSRFKHDYKLRLNDKENYKTLLNKKNKLFKKLENSGRVMKFRDKKILLIFLDEYISFVTLDFPDYISYVIVKSWGGVSVRLHESISDNGVTKDNLVNKINKLDYIRESGGHDTAFGAFINDVTPELLIQFSKELSTYIDIEIDRIKGK